MTKQFDILRVTRENILNLVSSFSHEELNEIPKGFNNNIAWNLGHIMVTQQLLHYGLSGNEFLLDSTYIEKYRKGTKPEGEISPEEIAFIKSQLKELVTALENDYENQKFDKTFKSYPTSYNVELNSIEDAIQFNNVHEGMHFGYMKGLINAMKG